MIYYYYYIRVYLSFHFFPFRSMYTISYTIHKPAAIYTADTFIILDSPRDLTRDGVTLLAMHAFHGTHPPPVCLYNITPLNQFSSSEEDISLSNDELNGGGGGCGSREGVLHAYSFVVGKRSYSIYLRIC